MAEVLIVGGGVIGCAVAYELSKAGAGATLLERGEIGGAASGAAAGMLIAPPWAAPPGPFRDLCRASLALYPSLVEALQEETDIDVQYVATGLLLVAESEPSAQALRQLAGWRGDPALELQWLEGAPLHRLEPGLSPSFPGAAYSPDQRHVNPMLLTRALAQAAARRGAALHDGMAAAARGFIRRGDRVIGVRSGHNTIAADQVVLAAGPWTRFLARKLGFDLPTPPMRGQMLAYRSSAIRHILWGSEGYLVPKPALSRAEGADGLIYAGATVEDVGFRNGTTTRGLAWLRKMARTLAPALGEAPVASAWAGLRPGSPDGLPILGRLPGWRNVYVASGHFRNGILLAPITGALIAQLILKGKTEMPLAPFSVERFR